MGEISKETLIPNDRHKEWYFFMVVWNVFLSVLCRSVGRQGAVSWNSVANTKKTVNICRYKQTAVKVTYEEKFPANRASCLAGNTETYSTTGVRNCVWYYDTQLLGLRIRIQKLREPFFKFFLFSAQLFTNRYYK
jgi:hypothetical protein